MLLIVGLGNLGEKYEYTRHNVGFMLADRVAEEHRIRFSRSGRALLGKGVVAGAEAIILKPLTFMNLSGEAVIEAVQFYKIYPSEIIAAYDDCDLTLGRLRIRKSGGSGGHRGVESMIRHLGSRDFARVRLGIGRPESGGAEGLAGYVLEPFASNEADALEEMLSRGVKAVETIITEGIEHAMNRFNA